VRQIQRASGLHLIAKKRTDLNERNLHCTVIFLKRASAEYRAGFNKVRGKMEKMLQFRGGVDSILHD
jgi:hypothetical protein